MLFNLCTKQSLPPAYFRLLWVCASSSPSQGEGGWRGDQAPFPPCQVGSSSPECSVPQYLLPAPLCANMKALGVEKHNPSRKVRCIKCCSHTFQERNSLRRPMQIVECSLLHWWAQSRVSSYPRTPTSFCDNLIHPKGICSNPPPQIL